VLIKFKPLSAAGLSNHVPHAGRVDATKRDCGADVARSVGYILPQLNEKGQGTQQTWVESKAGWWLTPHRQTVTKGG